jgi:glycosyltransferase involved in cell wall biosynthesis
MKKFISQEIKDFVSKALFEEKILLNKESFWPKISIVTPSYNQAEFLERTILSVLNQNYPNLEYIVIDGGSTDRSVDIIKKYENYISYSVSEPDKGQADAINKGFRIATGDISGWLNSDDIYLSNTLKNVVVYFKQNPNADIVFGNTLFINDKDEVIGDLKFTKFSLRSYIFKGFGLHQPSTFWKTEAFRDLGGVRDHFDFCMDTDFFMRMARAGKKFRFFNKYLACFRITKIQKSSIKSHIGLKERQEIIKELFNIDIDYDSLKFKLLNLFYQMRRFLLYLLQGKVDYILKLFFRWIKHERSFPSK